MKKGLPIIIGVTGHRELYEEDLPKIRTVFQEELSSLAKKYPSSGFLMLNSLATGADQLAAEVALDAGIPLVAVLPFAADEYRKDFTPEELPRFDVLLGKAAAVIVPEASSGNADRDSGYRRAGIYAAEHSHILFAFWDGIPGTEEGCGTGDIVTHLTESGEDYAIRQIPVRRKNHPPAEDCVHPLNPVSPVKTFSGNDSIRNVLVITDTFNRDVTAYNREFLRESRSETEKAEENATGYGLFRIEELYSPADALSGKNQKKYLRDLKGLALTGVGMVLAFLFYDELGLRICLPLYAFLLVFGAALLRRERKNHYYDNHLRYRMLAECLRVENVLLGAGIRFNAARYYPMTLEKETLWIRKGIDGLLVLSEKRETKEGRKNSYACSETGGEHAENEVSSPVHSPSFSCGSHEPKKSASLSRNWLEEQLSYHEKNLLRTRKKEERNRKISAVFRLFTILTVLASICFEFSGDSLYDATVFGEPFRVWVLIFMGLLSAGSLLLSLYYGKLALFRKAEDSEHMIALYRRALRLAERSGLTEELIRETAREEILENADWYSYSRENAPEINI